MGGTQSYQIGIGDDDLRLPTTLSELSSIPFFYSGNTETYLNSSGEPKDADEFMQRHPREALVHKYSVLGSLRSGRPLGTVIVATAGGPGSGKSTTINKLFQKKICSVGSNTYDKTTTEISHYDKSLKIAAETPVIAINIRFVDVPGMFGTTDHAKCKKALCEYVAKCPHLETRSSIRFSWCTSKIKGQNPSSSFIKEVFPNIVLFTLKATEDRIYGEESTFMQILKTYVEAGFVDTKNSNLIIVLTHVMSVHRNDNEVVKKIKNLTEAVQDLVWRKLQIPDVPVVPIENEADTQGLLKVGEFHMLPDNQTNYRNLFDAMIKCTRDNNDYLATLVLGWYFSRT